MQTTDLKEEERLRSVVISNVSEIGDNITSKQTNDMNFVNDLINELNIDANYTKIFRMGSQKITKTSTIDESFKLTIKNTQQPRLLKLVLVSSTQQKNLLRLAKKLKNTQKFSNLFIRPSLTFAQREAEFKLRCELRDRRAKGEKVGFYGWPGEANRKIIVFNQENVNLNQGNL